MYEATETGDLDWLKKLLPTFCYDHLTVFKCAAQYGNLALVKWLTSEIRSHAGWKEEGKLDYYAPGILKEATMSATYNGHREIVNFLLLEIETNADGEDEDEELNELAWKVLKTAAYAGYLDVVKCAAEYAHVRASTGPTSEYSKALTNAIDHGHFEVVSFLINHRQYHWDLKRAFEQALTLTKQDILETMYKVDQEVVNGDDLVVRLAEWTQLNICTTILKLMPRQFMVHLNAHLVVDGSIFWRCCWIPTGSRKSCLMRLCSARLVWDLSIR